MTDATSKCPGCGQGAHAILRNTSNHNGQTWHTLCLQQERQRPAATVAHADDESMAWLRAIGNTIKQAERDFNVHVIVALRPGFVDIRVIDKEHSTGHAKGIEDKLTVDAIALANIDIVTIKIVDMARALKG